MLQLNAVFLLPGEDPTSLWEKAATILRIQRSDVLELKVLRRSIDARETVRFVYRVAVSVRKEEKLLQRNRHLLPYVVSEPYCLPEAIVPPNIRPVVVGAGPAGLFCALTLARCGARPILLERGRPVEQRKHDVTSFWNGGTLLSNSNVQFGEGGAGAFSDGKLNTGTRDMRHQYILEELVRCGAPEEILIDARPHVGTDKLYTVLQNMRRELLAAGTDIRFGHCLKGIHIEGDCIYSLEVQTETDAYTLSTRQLALAIGNGARDSFEMLYRLGVPMEVKPFAVGVRIEHLQSEMDAVQYKAAAGHPSLPASSYKLATHLSDGRGVFSFCVCPGGEVVAATSEAGHLVTNGMSLLARDGKNINGGLLVSVSPKDFGSGVLDGIAFQRNLEQAAFRLGGGKYAAPAQLVGDFLSGRTSSHPGHIQPTYRPGVHFCALDGCLPPLLCTSLRNALPALEHKLPGFATPEAILTAVETRSSAPLRILRDETGQSALHGLFPCGEGAGYAGGIMSAAADGIKCAEHILEVLRK